MKRILFAVLFAAYVLLIYSCTAPRKSGCPTGNGNVPGKFKSNQSYKWE